jgi:hypothetical protein
MLEPACTWSDTTTGVWCGCSVTLDVDIVAGVGCYVQLRPVNACGLSRVFLLLLCRAAAVSSSGVRGCEARGPMCEPQISHLNACERDSRGAFVRTDGGFSSPLCRYHVTASTGKVRDHDGVRGYGATDPMYPSRRVELYTRTHVFAVPLCQPLAELYRRCADIILHRAMLGFAALLGRTPFAGPSTPPLRRVRMLLWLHPKNAGVTSRRLWIAGLNRRCAAIKMQG